MKEQIKEYNDKMQKTIDHLESEFATIRAGRANPHVLDRISWQWLQRNQSLELT